MSKKPKVSNLKRTADRVFSEIVRRSAANEDGYAQCVSCNLWLHWTDGDAGHFCSRKHNNTRYDKRNVQFQCRSCNRFYEGKKYEFGKWLVEKYGEDIIDELNQLAHQPKRFKVLELQELIEELRKELKELK